ncbi:MAG TPA: hypothetical protein VK929_01510 [Longimicrobiales bacterium]|nr:hypothetical protein [Longimicrobiales bacterium]
MRRHARSLSQSFAALLACWFITGCGGGVSEPPDEQTQVVCDVATSRCYSRLRIAPGAFLPLYSSYALDTRNERVTHAIIMVHGANRDADAYFTTTVVAARGADRLNETLIVAPHFQKAEDEPRADEPIWTEEGWKRGHLSVTGRQPPRVSSYAALDRIVEVITDGALFPNITRVVVAGHSAGGQVVHRYAAGSRAENTARSSVAFRYAVANPSTYLYLGPERPHGDSFAVPDTAACPGWNDWHYGLSGLNSYMDAVPAATVTANLSQRDVHILIGDGDTGSAQLDVSCGANLQGAHRFERGRLLVRYMDYRFPGHGHAEEIVPDVAHSSRGMFTSTAGARALFQ